MKPSCGVFLPTLSASAPIDVETLRRMAVTAEDRGLEHIFVGDHLIWNSGILAPLVTLAHLAAVTERVRLGSGVYLLPVRPPVVTAKDAATLDVLSGGRLIMGVGGEARIRMSTAPRVSTPGTAELAWMRAWRPFAPCSTGSGSK